MKMNPVKSSNIIAIGYDNGTMRIEFKSGIYEWENVSQKTFDRFTEAESKGKFFKSLDLPKGKKL